MRRLSKVLEEQVQRETDVVARYGGEEFAVILPDTSLEAALIVGERIRKRAADVVVSSGEMEVRFTVSVGIAENGSNIEGYEGLIEKADKALYLAKDNGRNMVVMNI